MVEQLYLIIEKSKRPGTITQVQNTKTDTGIKDTFLDHFLKKMADSYCGLKGKATKALNKFCVTFLPIKIISPVWRVNGTLHLLVTVENIY